jgi:autotransporter family porin
MITTLRWTGGVLILIALATALTGCGADDQKAPAPGGYAAFDLLPPGSALPSAASCAAKVRDRFDNGWEPRASTNAVANRTVPDPKPDLGTLPDFDGMANTGGQWAPRVDGAFRGTTEAILLWAACKWGLDDEWLRAQMGVESWWNQRTVGDFTLTKARCPSDAVYDSKGRCAESYGLLQNKYRFNRTAYPAFRRSTAYQLDFSAFKLRACYDGHKYVSGGAAGDWRGCLGNWYSGAWHDALGEKYYGWVVNAKAQHVWTRWPDTDG